MSLEIQFARDANGKPTASTPPPRESVGAFFERDIGPDPTFGDEILEMIDDIVSGREWPAQQIAAAPPRLSYVTVDESAGERVVEVCCDVGESGALYRDSKKDRHGTFLLAAVALADFRAALVNWLVFIRSGAIDAEAAAAPDPGSR
jgi:hypothetical protein